MGEVVVMSGLFGGGSSRLFELQQSTQNQLGTLQTQAYEDEALAEEAQANYAQADAEAAAAQKENEVRSFMASQASGYLNSGVTLQGSPLDVLDSTRQQGRQEIQAILDRGVAAGDLYRRRAAITRNSGRAQLLGQNYNMTSQKLAYDMAERKQFGASAYGLLGSAAGMAARPIFGSLFKSVFGNP